MVGLNQHADDDTVDPDVDFERLKSASIGLALILAEAIRSPTGQTTVGKGQIEGIYDALSEAMLGYAWLRDEVVGEERGNSLMAQLQAGLSEDEQKVLKQIITAPALRAD